MKRSVVFVALVSLVVAACGSGGEETRNVAIPSQDVLARILPSDAEGLPGEQASVALTKSTNQFCSITSRGSLMCWGTVKTGPVSFRTEYVPTAVTPPTPAPVTAVAIDASHRCVVSAGEVYCTGHNVNRQVSPTASYEWLTWTRVDLPFVAADVATNIWASCAVSTDGRVACWGSATSALLGEYRPAAGGNGPYLISNLNAVRQVELSGENACAVEADGDVMCWGRGSWGLLGGAPQADTPRPVRVGLQQPAVDIDMEDETACAALSDGRIWCWGKYPAGGTILPAPQRVTVWSHRAAVSVDVLPSTMCAVDDRGTAWCWGRLDGVLRDWPYAVTDGSTDAMTIEGVSWQGNTTHCIQTWNASVLCFGWNSAGQLGRDPRNLGKDFNVRAATGLGGVIGGTRAPLGATTSVAAPATSAAPATGVAPGATSAPGSAVAPGATSAPAGATGAPTETTVAGAVPDGSAVAVAAAVERATTSKVNVRLKKGKSVGYRTLVRHARLVAPKGAKISVTVPKKHRRACALSGASLVGARVGSCKVTVKVTPKRSRPRTAVVVVDVVK